MDVSQVRIKVKTEILRNISNEVITKTVRTRDAVNQINSIICSTNLYWEGEGQRQAKMVYEQKGQMIDKVFQDIYSAITDLQKIAGVYEENEKLVKDYSGALLGDVIH